MSENGTSIGTLKPTNTPCLRKDHCTDPRSEALSLGHHRTNRGKIDRLHRNINGRRGQDVVQREILQTLPRIHRKLVSIAISWDPISADSFPSVSQRDHTP
ncbi:hypothetical protein DPMN_141640 [Dreissena polymorpha]|uniref:Uncharacterized protein n=1 Tax=Dreissena polymorpha TaxID=45954 RepID=A0A9D4GA42_DREPO|nr:hypothetical protein DPMN_141640 [Dreissena polymorpha]